MQTSSPSVRCRTEWFYGLLLRQVHNLTRLRRNALVTTDTELNAMAAPAKIGDKSRPNAGYSTPAATGMPIAL